MKGTQVTETGHPYCPRLHSVQSPRVCVDRDLGQNWSFQQWICLIVLLPSSHTLLGSLLPSTQSLHSSGQHLVGNQHHKFWLVYPMSLLPSPLLQTLFLLFTCFYFVGRPGIALAELGPAQKEAPRSGLPVSIPEQIKGHGAHLCGKGLEPSALQDS